MTEEEIKLRGDKVESLRKRSYKETEITDILRALNYTTGTLEIPKYFDALEKERTRAEVFKNWKEAGFSDSWCNERWLNLLSNPYLDLVCTKENVANLSCLPPKVEDYGVTTEEVREAELKREDEFERKKEAYENKPTGEEIVNEATLLLDNSKKLSNLKERVDYIEAELGNFINFFDNFLFRLENIQSDMFLDFQKIDCENNFTRIEGVEKEN